MTVPTAPITGANTPPFELKASLFTLTVMRLHHADPKRVDRHLLEKVKQAPAFFDNSPVVIDLGALSGKGVNVDFAALSDVLRSRGMIPVGVRNGGKELEAAAVLAGLPLLPERATTPGKSSGKQAAEEKKEAANTGSSPQRHSRIVTHPVRSGQQVYAADGDLVLLGPVSHGAEVLADGNIHVYGSIRGRILAGAKGDTQARIFCQKLEAELVSIAGHYRVIEQPEGQSKDEPVQVYLSEGRLLIEPLSR